MNRVVAYVDGFNLYYGLREAHWRRYYWLNIQALAQELLLPGQELVVTKYFTSRVSSTPDDPHKSKRQGTYLEALQTLKAFRIFYGHYLWKRAYCPNCRTEHIVYNEKMSDVNLAVELLSDAFTDAFDTALLMSADSDLSGAIRTVRRLFPAKRIVVWFPPRRQSQELARVANFVATIGRDKLARNQFPESIRKSDGYILRRPEQWKGHGG